MNTADQASDGLYVTIQDGDGYVYIRGRGSFKIGPALKRFGLSAINGGARNLVLDMRECIGMDSTFMGILAGLACRLARENGKVILINLTSRTRGLLATLGLDQLVASHMLESSPPELTAVFNNGAGLKQVSAGAETPLERAEVMLDAHQTLVDVIPENQPKFQDVLVFLREDVEKQRSDGGGTG